MAGYREHITVSGLLGVAYAGAATFMFGFSLVPSMIAGVLTWISGMLPDLDSESGRPVRELPGIFAALLPMLLIQHIHRLGVQGDRVILFAILNYVIVRYVGAFLLARLTVHRGMFHSIPALLIAAECAFLTYPSESLRVRTLMGIAVGIGFLSHLLLDEMYSVQWDGTKVRLAKSSGSAMKFFGSETLPNSIAMGTLLVMSYATAVQSGFLKDPGRIPAPEFIEVTAELPDAPLFRIVEHPGETEWR